MESSKSIILSVKHLVGVYINYNRRALKRETNWSNFISIDPVEIRVTDLDLNDNSVGKSSIGCYVYHNGKLLDVMVPSELEQSLQVYFNDPLQRIQIIVRPLGQETKKYGKNYSSNLKISYMFKLC